MAEVSLIPSSDYKEVADAYDLARRQMAESAEYLKDAVQVIVDLQATVGPNDYTQVELELLRPLWDSYVSVRNFTDSDAAFLGGVGTVQTHVLSNSAYATMDAYFAGEGLTIGSYWQSMSESAGYTISDDYVNDTNVGS
mgnify:CR=1 FL=1